MEANYLSMGRWIHCLACHKNVDREEFLDHVETHPHAVYETTCECKMPAYE